MRTGTVGHNGFRTDCIIRFGGIKQSGLWREGGHDGLLPYLESNTIQQPGISKSQDLQALVASLVIGSTGQGSLVSQTFTLLGKGATFQASPGVAVYMNELPLPALITHSQQGAIMSTSKTFSPRRAAGDAIRAQHHGRRRATRSAHPPPKRHGWLSRFRDRQLRHARVRRRAQRGGGDGQAARARCRYLS